METNTVHSNMDGMRIWMAPPLRDDGYAISVTQIKKLEFHRRCLATMMDRRVG
jgi:hypothetical protein